MENKVAIVLTGTIIPTTNHVVYTSVNKRRSEYIIALNFYTKYANVYFLENSSYDIFNDKEFMSIKNVKYVKIASDKNRNNSIGYQEFKMIDDWITINDDIPSRWIKISGRYIFKNIREILEQCSNTNKDLIMDINIHYKWAKTFIFYVKTEFYKEHFIKKYSLCTSYINIEQIFYAYLRTISMKNVTFFCNEPVYEVVTAGVGKKVSSGNMVKGLINNAGRKINMFFFPCVLIYCNPFLMLYRCVRNIGHFYFKMKD